MNTDWALIVAYRDFYDIPHAMVVDWRSCWYFLDCPFDDLLDDYLDVFHVYRLRDREKELPTSWVDLVSEGDFVGELPARLLAFDTTKRAKLRGSAIDSVLRGRDAM